MFVPLQWDCLALPDLVTLFWCSRKAWQSQGRVSLLSLPLLSRSGRKGQRDSCLLVLYFCLCLSKKEYPELEGSWKDGVKVTGIKAYFIFLFHFGGRIWKYLCNLPCWVVPARSWWHFPLLPRGFRSVNQRLFVSTDAPIEICTCGKSQLPVFLCCSASISAATFQVQPPSPCLALQE